MEERFPGDSAAANGFSRRWLREDEAYLLMAANYPVRPDVTGVNAYLVSDVTKVGFCDLDYGWGMPVFAGPAKGGVGVIPGVASFIIAVKNAVGEDGIAVPLCLPAPAMDKFMDEISKLMRPVVLADISPRINSAM